MSKINILALITARGGSKGLPGKNIKPLNGFPLIYYSIEAAIKSKYIDKNNIFCTTDSDEIANVALQYNCRVIKRPYHLSDDKATSISVVLHALDYLKSELQKEFDYLLLLQPTSPLRTVQHIDEAIELAINKNADSVISVFEAKYPPYHMKLINEQGILTDFIKHNYSRRQDMPVVYSVNGAIYITKTNVLKNDKNFYGKNSFPYLMSWLESIDIDDINDFKLAEFLIKKK